MIHIEIGKKGELVAIKYLKKLKYKILVHDYRRFCGEIDIIAKYKDIIVFVEVKTFDRRQQVLPRININAERIKRYRDTAMYYLKETNQQNSRARFDVIEIISEEVFAHLEAAF